MFGEHISISQALFVTLLSMGTVFVVLATIAFLLGYFEKLFSDPKPQQEPVSLAEESTPIELVENDGDDPALIAVITAAILANQTASYPIRIRKIRRVGETQAMWHNQESEIGGV